MLPILLIIIILVLYQSNNINQSGGSKISFNETLAIKIISDILALDNDIRYSVYRKIYIDFLKLSKKITGIQKNKSKYFLYYLKKYSSHIKHSDKIIPKEIINKNVEIILNLNEQSIMRIYNILRN